MVGDVESCGDGVIGTGTFLREEETFCEALEVGIHSIQDFLVDKSPNDAYSSQFKGHSSRLLAKTFPTNIRKINKTKRLGIPQQVQNISDELTSSTNRVLLHCSHLRDNVKFQRKSW